MNKNLKILLTVFVLTLIGGFLRFYNNPKNHISLNIDEVSYGYSAFSILKTAHDENGVFMPLAFQSTGDYKSPILIYSLVPSIAVFGLNEFAVRFTTALAGILSIPVFFMLLKKLLKNIQIALIGTALLAISPWHIFYSRLASESLMSTFFLMLGVLFFLKMLEGGKIWAIGASIFLTLSMYTYHSQRLFIPVFIFLYLLAGFKRFKQNISNIRIFVLSSLLLVSPLVYLTIFGSAGIRAGMVFLSQDIEYTRYVVLDHIQKFGEEFLLFFFWIKRYLNYFQPDFLFFNGLNMTIPGTLGLGVLYLFELPWLILGIIKLFKNISARLMIILWILLGIIPASLANNDQSSVRSLLILPALLVIVSLGAQRFFEMVIGLSNRSIKLGLFCLYGFFIILALIQAYLVFAVHFPIQRGEDFMEGTKETVLYALDNKDKYQEIVYDPYRGTEAPYIVNIPHMYILFYSQYDPKTFQKEVLDFPKYGAHFDKFTIRPINWREDRSKKGVLFIGSPWSLPTKDLKDGEILQRVYLSNGKLAFLIVSPK